MLPSAAPTTPRARRGNGPYTPKSATSMHRPHGSGFGKPLRTPTRSPFFQADSPRDGAVSPDTNVREHPQKSPFLDSYSPSDPPLTPSSSLGLSLFLPTPSTVGTGRKPRSNIALYRHSRSKPLLEKLQQAAHSEETGESHQAGLLDAASIHSEPSVHEADQKPQHKTHQKGLFSGTSEISTSEIQNMSLFSPRIHVCSQDMHESNTTPSTPVQNPVVEQKARFDAFSDNEDAVQIVDYSDLERIPRHEIPNPFLERNLGPRSSDQRREIDYSTHIEKMNFRTGERTVEKIPKTSLRFKPRKLDFTSAVDPSPDYKIANKYVESNIGKNFTMGETRPKGSLDFEIFNDEK